jgi:hypothetical protein
MRELAIILLSSIASASNGSTFWAFNSSASIINSIQKALSLYDLAIGNWQSAIGNWQSPCVFNRLASLFEHLAVPDEACARIGCQLEVLGQFQT